MAGSRAPIVVGILAIAGGITWFALRERGSEESLTAGGTGGSAGNSKSGKAAISAPEGPSLGGSGANAFDQTPRPALPDAQSIDAPSHRDVFTAQPRDPRWAPRTEDELEDRVRTLTLTSVQAVECRTDQCELLLAGPSADIEATIAKLEGPKGLTTLAKSMLLGGPERNGDQLTLRVYALFERAPEP